MIGFLIRVCVVDASFLCCVLQHKTLFGSHATLDVNWDIFGSIIESPAGAHSLSTCLPHGTKMKNTRRRSLKPLGCFQDTISG